MNKLTYNELLNVIHKHNDENNIVRQYSDPNPLYCVAVISNDSFSQEYSLESRSYRFRSDEKRFLPEMLGNSIFANALDGTDDGVRLDWYIYGGEDAWKIEYCYIENEGDK